MAEKSKTEARQFKPDILIRELSEEEFKQPGNLGNQKGKVKAEEDKVALLVFKAIIVLVLVVMLIINHYTEENHNVKNIRDRIFDFLDKINQEINSNKTYASSLQIASSGLLDLTFFGLSIYWMFYGTSCRPMVTAGMFYGIRGLIQSYFYMPYPPGTYWSYPGWPSLVVPYGLGSDFFYSGHCGFLTICTSEWFALGQRVVGSLSLFATCFMAFVVTAFRIHYVIDVAFGVVIAHYSFIIVDTYVAKHIDNYFIGLYKRLYPKRQEEIEIVTENKKGDIKTYNSIDEAV